MGDGILGNQVESGVVAYANNSSTNGGGLNVEPVPFGTGDTGYGDPATVTVYAHFNQVN